MEIGSGTAEVITVSSDDEEVTEVISLYKVLDPKPDLYVIADDDDGSTSEDNHSSVSQTTYGQRTLEVGSTINENIPSTATSSSNAEKMDEEGHEVTVITLESFSDAETERGESPAFEEDLAYSSEATQAIQMVKFTSLFQ